MRTTIIVGLLLIFSFAGFSQANHLPLNDYDSEFFARLEKEQLRYLDSLYVVESGCVRDFINGKDYQPYYFHSDNKPILFSDKERTASLICSGRVYDNLVLQYDTYLDQVIYFINSLGSDNILRMVALNRYTISKFVLYFDNDTLTFRFFSDEADPAFNLEDGFYELVYDGMCKYLVKHKSTNYELNGVDEYAYEPSGYVMVGDRFVRITSRKQFVNLFCNKSKEINQFMTEKRIKLRRADKHEISGILKFYESIDTGCR